MPFQGASIQDFLGKFAGGARANRFSVEVHRASTGGAFKDFQFLCKAASIPLSSIGVAEVAYMGRTIKVPGDKEFDDWTVTVYNDVNWNLRGEFEKWLNDILQHGANTTKMSEENEDYFGSAIVHQLDRKGEEIKAARYEFKNMFPTAVGEIELAWDNNNAIETFDVTFAINHWESGNTDILNATANALAG